MLAPLLATLALVVTSASTTHPGGPRLPLPDGGHRTRTTGMRTDGRRGQRQPVQSPDHAPYFRTGPLAGVHDADLNALFADALPKVEAKTQIAVLLPDTMPTDAQHLFPEHWQTKKTYTLSLGAVRHCGEATACFEADFMGQKGGTPFGSRQVALARGRHGRFKPLSCGASCSPPSVSWSERGATYTIQANVGTARTERRILVAMANQAIRRGPR
jgi:hypothetical protein